MSGWLGDIYGQAISKGVTEGIEPYLEEQMRRKRQEADLNHRLNAEQKLFERDKENFEKELSYFLGAKSQAETNNLVNNAYNQAYEPHKPTEIDNSQLIKKAVQQAYQNAVLDSVPPEHKFTRHLIQQGFDKENEPTLIEKYGIKPFSQTQEFENFLQSQEIGDLLHRRDKVNNIVDGIHSRRALQEAENKYLYPQGNTFRQEIQPVYENDKFINRLMEYEIAPNGQIVSFGKKTDFDQFNKYKHEADMLNKRLYEARQREKIKHGEKPMSDKDIYDRLIQLGINQEKYPDLHVALYKLMKKGHIGLATKIADAVIKGEPGLWSSLIKDKEYLKHEKDTKDINRLAKKIAEEELDLYANYGIGDNYDDDGYERDEDGLIPPR